MKRLITVAISMVLVAGLIGCSDSDNEIAELRAELAEIKTELEEIKENQSAPIQEIAPLEEETKETVEVIVEDELNDADHNNDKEILNAIEETSLEESYVDPLLTAPYQWYQAGISVRRLQELLGVKSDGVYGSGTRTAHIAALQNLGLSTGNVPELGPVPTPIPSPTPIPEIQIGCALGFSYSAGNNEFMTAINFIDGIPDNYWWQITLSGLDIGAVNITEDYEGVKGGQDTSWTRDEEMPDSAITQLNNLYFQVSTTGERIDNPAGDPRWCSVEITF